MSQPKHFERVFQGYMTTCYGKAWAMTLPESQIRESRQHFFMGALAYQAETLKIANMSIGDEVTQAEEAAAQKLADDFFEEIEEFGEKHILDLFAAYGTGRT